MCSARAVSLSGSRGQRGTVTEKDLQQPWSPVCHNDKERYCKVQERDERGCLFEAAVAQVECLTRELVCLNT